MPTCSVERTLGLAGRSTLAAAKDANRLLPYWPDSALELAQIKAFDSVNSGSAASADLGRSAPNGRPSPRAETPGTQNSGCCWRARTFEFQAVRLARTDYYRALSCDKCNRRRSRVSVSGWDRSRLGSSHPLLWLALTTAVQ